ncbi:MAG: PAS domain-containing protein [Pseudomonadota bacterium]
MQLSEDEIGFLVDGERRILGITDLALDFLGLNRMDVLTMNFFNFMDEKDRRGLKEGFKKGLKGISERIAFRLKVNESETRPFEGKLLRMSAKNEKGLLILLRELRNGGLDE